MTEAAAAPLRERLDDMRKQLSRVEQRVAVEAVKRKGSLDSEIQALAADVNELQEQLTAEVKARVATAHTLSRDIAETLNRRRNEMQAKEDQVDHECDQVLRECKHFVEAYLSRVKVLAQGLSGGLPAEPAQGPASSTSSQAEMVERAQNLAVDTFELNRRFDEVAKRAEAFESQELTEALGAIDGEHRRLLQKIRNVKANALQWLQEGLPEYEASVAATRTELAAQQKKTSAMLQEFEAYLMSELKVFAAAIENEAAAREETDDHLVTVLNEWNEALRKGFATIARS